MKTRLLECGILTMFLVFTLGSSFLFSQPITGTKTIPGDYATIESAISALNTNGVGAGGVVFNVAAGHTETFTTPTAGTLLANGTSTDQITFQKSGVGVNPLITAALNGTGNADGIIKIAGGDYITFSGIDVQENAGNTDATTWMEWGYALVKKNAAAPFDGCRFVVIRNSNITLNQAHTTSVGIYSGNHTATSTSGLTLTDTLDAMSYCSFYGNSVGNVHVGISLNGSTLAAYYDQFNEIGNSSTGNVITNYGGSSSTSRGIYAQYQNNLKIANNSLNGGSLSHTGSLYGISTGSATNANLDIFRNSITLTSGGTSAIMYALTNSIGSSGVDNTVNIYDNTIENCTQPNASGNSWWLIYQLSSPANANIYGNTIRNNSRAAGTVYGINSSGGANNHIYNNEIYNNSCGGVIYGVYVTNDNASIYGNKIYDIRSTSSSTTLTVAGIAVATGPTSAYIYNNFISDLKSPNCTSADAIRGIGITSTTANSNIGVYYNTVFLTAFAGGGNFGTSGIYHTNSSTSTSSTLDMRNNIVVNLSTANGTGKTSAFRRSAANVNLSNYSTVSNNNSFYAGTPGVSNVIFYDGTNYDETIGDFKTRVAPRETNSFTENVPFVNNSTAPYNLHVRTDLPTQTEGTGTPVSTPVIVTNDIDNEVRNALTPDVGADEFNGIGSDITPPFISYTPLVHTTLLTNRVLTGVVITDGSGINTTSGTSPRIYYKRASDNNTVVDNTSSTNGWKYTQTSGTSSPFDFTIDYSLLFGGTGVQSGDTIQYFVVAQDLANPANVGISEGTFAVTPTSVNLTAAAFPLTGTINEYRLIYLLNGTVTIGSGGDFTSLTGSNGFFTAVNENILTGNVNAQIISDINEPGAVALNQWVEQGTGNYTLTIQPSSAVMRTLSGSSSLPGLITINGADRVVIDGRFSGNGNFLTFQNTNAAANTTCIHVVSLGAGAGATDVTIRNCNIKAGTNSLSNVFGIFVGATTLTTSSSGGADNHNLILQNNIVSSARVGIFVRGTSSNLLNNLVVTGNSVGSNNSAEYITEYGINIQAAAAPQVTFNEVYNIVYDVSKWGIYFGSNVSNAIVSKNKVHSIDQPGTSGFNSVGIYFASATGCSDNQIDNNMIYNLNTYGNVSMYLVGIRIVGGNNYKIYYNSVSMTGTIANPSAGMVSSCLYISTATTGADIRNNIFLNTRTGMDPKNYLIHSPNSTTFTHLDNNAYWNTGNTFGFFGSDIASFNDWKIAIGQDTISVNANPMFVSSTDLHINAGMTPTLLESAGAVIPGVTTDFDGDVRPGPAGSVNGGAFAPDLGADEFDGVPVIVPVELNSFTLKLIGRDVNLAWVTSSEVNNRGFYVERNNGEGYTSLGFVEGKGTYTGSTKYSFTDKKVEVGSYQYRLKQVDYDGSLAYSEILQTEVTVPDVYALEQNYPNPFNPSTVIRFSLPEDVSNVTVTIYNALGQRITELVNSKLEAGQYEFEWNASNLASGLYIYELRTEKFSSVKKMMLMK
ncbi:MAG: T9SS type A sorting domain-containing protein [Ignavibacteriales bacterium]|nr:MAG: T9SS type A sorting domain-containing protein [Ignavibacteriales bacterium]